PICEGIYNHIARRWKALSSIPFPEFKLPGHCRPGMNESRAPTHKVYLSRTIAELDQQPGGVTLVREVEFLFRDLIASAQRRIILEGQYYWSKILNDLLIAKIKKMRGKDFEVYLILSDLRYVKSFSKKMMPYELRLLEQLNEAARLSKVKLVINFPSVFPPTDTGPLPPKPIYVHSKVIVIDDHFLGIGSANLASRALRIDTEIHLTLEAQSEAERGHISDVANFILNHWQLCSPSASSGISSQIFQTESTFRELRKISLSRQIIPWEFFFDPVLPWFYLLKRKYRGFPRRRWYPVVYTLGLIWIFGAFFTWLIAGVYWSQSQWSIYYLAILSSVWLLPIPFILIQILMVFHLGYPEAIKIGVSALWVASALGYMVARYFPAYSSCYYGLDGPSWLPERLGLRSFPVLLSVLLDPRVSIRSKIAYQGIYCIPMPWFILGTGIVLPAILYIAARLEAYILLRIIPELVSNLLKKQIGPILIGIFIFCFGNLGVRLWEKKS
ncbi:MAG: phospholipase D-like domain-containing protein, partial [Bdellovibrionia bacterium]